MEKCIIPRALGGGLILVVCLLAAYPVRAQPSATGTSEAPPDPTAEAAKEAVLAFVRALDYFELEGFVDSFSKEATLFFPMPWAPERVDGRAAIHEAQKREFARARERLAKAGKTSPPFLDLVALDMRVQVLGDEVAVVTWHVDRGTHLGRRTAVVQEQPDGTWRIVSFHASNMDTPTQ